MAVGAGVSVGVGIVALGVETTSAGVGEAGCVSAGTGTVSETQPRANVVMPKAIMRLIVALLSTDTPTLIDLPTSHRGE